MDKHKEKVIKRKRKHARIRTKISGTAERPRLSVFVSSRYISSQLIDDNEGKTLVSATSQGMESGSLVEKAREVGRSVARKAQELHFKKVVFDRGGFLYSGKVKAIAEGAREAGLIF
ncbi:MAG: 50S ribosomal protein L18 [Candidatus Pacebacteria bacterium]|nr:50S ribosomal protein L18 [Candidatus Paceibacterota bacterium]